MELTNEQEHKVKQVIEVMSKGNEMVMESPSTKVMAINLLESFNWNIDETIKSLG